MTSSPQSRTSSTSPCCSCSCGGVTTTTLEHDAPMFSSGSPSVGDNEDMMVGSPSPKRGRCGRSTPSAEDDGSRAEEGGKTTCFPDRRAKKSRYTALWESIMMEGGKGVADPGEDRAGNGRADETKLGLSDLFAPLPSSCGEGDRQGQQGRETPPREQLSFRERGDDGMSFFTLRLEHREGGVTARHRGEERILVFRSDRHGAIGKIIYSSTPARVSLATKRAENNTEEELGRMAQAKIHVLDVKEPYRGYDLGGLLFTEAIASLRHRYMDDEEEEDDCEEQEEAVANDDDMYYSSSIRCQLDAEEDIRRHDKLVGFYRNLGCHVKPKAKVLYLNNNDGETYRKVPMQIALRSNKPPPSKVSQPPADARVTAARQPPPVKSDAKLATKKAQDAGSLVGKNIGFLPVSLFDAPGKRVAVPSTKFASRATWLMVEDGQGSVLFRTTKGEYLRAASGSHTGRATCEVVSIPDEDLVDGEDSRSVDVACKFRLLRVSDFDPPSGERVRDGEEERRERRSASSANLPREALAKELWMMQSRSMGSFLMLDKSSASLCCSRTPSFWQADGTTYSLTCTSDTPPRRHHYRTTWEKQTVEYVSRMRRRYLSFDKRKMSLPAALDLAKKLPAFPLGVNEHGYGVLLGTPSLRTRCFRTAEHLRQCGSPDWVQLVALVYYLGSVMNCIDHQTAIDTEDEYDWTVASRSRVVGCSPVSKSVVFHEYRSLNADERDPRYNTPLGMYERDCGLDKVMLTWTGPEYMYHMLKHNDAHIPQEGIVMLRLASLSDWHVNKLYGQVTNEEDGEVREMVSEFDDSLREVKDAVKQSGQKEDFSDEECVRLWETHYKAIAVKYGVDGNLRW